jgi:hypothetical protein
MWLFLTQRLIRGDPSFWSEYKSGSQGPYNFSEAVIKRFRAFLVSGVHPDELHCPRKTDVKTWTTTEKLFFASPHGRFFLKKFMRVQKISSKYQDAVMGLTSSIRANMKKWAYREDVPNLKEELSVSLVSLLLFL